MNVFNRFEMEISKERDEHRPIKLRQGGLRYLITKNRLNFLFKSYRPLFFEKDYITFPYRDKDLATWLVVLRYHFKLWVEIDATSGFLNIYKIFPEAFMVIKEVNKENHWYIEETFPEGTILYLVKDNYGVVNWLKGIPLTKSLDKEAGMDISPTIQINYEYIKNFSNYNNE